MGTKTPQVDSHFHIWQPGKFKIPLPPLPDRVNREVTIEEYEQNRKTTPVEYSVFVQALNRCPEEAEWLLSLSEQYPSIKGIVAGLDLTSPQLREQLTKYKASGKIVGVRHLLQIEEDEQFILRGDVGKGLAILQDMDMTYDFDAWPRFLKHQVKVVKSFPRLKFVVDHIGLPVMKGEMDMEWKGHIAELGNCPNVYCKISGLVSRADPKTWKADDFRDNVLHVLQCFGVDRCMFGGDWPIGLGVVGVTYREVYDLAHTLLGHLSQQDKDKIFGLNAIRFYGLDIPT